MRLKHIFIVLLSLTQLRVGGQTYNFRNYTEDNGLDQSYIYHISQSATGFLYLSTGEGLTVFDGNKFNTFREKTLTDNFVNTHYIDSKETVWIGHVQNGLSYLRNGKIIHLNNDKISSFKVTQIRGDAQNTLWIATLGGGFFQVKNDQLTELKSSVANINSFCFTPGGLLAATSEGLEFFHIKGGRELEAVSRVSHFENSNVKQIVPASETGTAYWVLVEGQGIYRVEKNGSSFSVALHIYDELNSEKKNITSMCADQTGNLWVGLLGEGLRKIILNKNKSNFNVLKIDQNNGLKNTYIQSIYQDSEGNLWFGTFGGGLIEKPVEKFSFFGAKEGIGNSNVRKIITDEKGNLWIGTSEGLAFYNKETSVYKMFNGSNGFVNDKVNTLLLDTDGKLWIGTGNNGIFRLNLESQQFENITAKYKLQCLAINCLLKTGNRLLAGSTEGLCSVDLESGETELVTTAQGLMHNKIIDLYYDSKDRLWVCSHGSPPYYIKDRKVVPFKNVPGLSSFKINAVTEDRKGNIWIATDGDGVFMYDNSSFKNYNTSAGLLSDYCYGIATDDNNSVWVSHKSGLSEKKDFHNMFNSFSNKNGLLYFENNLNAVHKDQYNNLWFGTAQGIVHYDAGMGGNKDVIPKLFITGVRLNGSPVPLTEPIIRKYGYYSVKVDYMAISLTDPQSIKYKYRLLGADSSWKSTVLTSADFPRLNDGEYTFEVIASNANGIFTSVPARLSFTIEPPVWKKMWFYTVLVGLIIILTYVSVYFRIRSLKKNQALLQESVRQKTYLLQKEKEEVEKIKVELERKNKDITDSINYAKRIQDSLLPPEHHMNKLFLKKYFILYKPKDIVSGDFYWCAPLKINEDVTLSLAAVVDCTGHGVPGAFLSIVANDFLKQSLNNSVAHNVNHVLDLLNKSIISNLNQSSNAKARVKDGMDIALIGIDYMQKKLYYSGANNPVYVYRRLEDKTQLTILHPTKQAIGLMTDSISSYELCEFDLLPGDTIYLFSDGYADQFGGDRDKKLNYKRFKEILAHAFELPMGLQRNFLEKKFEEWRRETEQTDDVCVMGIRI